MTTTFTTFIAPAVLATALFTGGAAEAGTRPDYGVELKTISAAALLAEHQPTCPAGEERKQHTAADGTVTDLGA